MLYVQCPEDESCDISEISFFARKPNYKITAQPTNKTVIKISKHQPIPGFVMLVTILQTSVSSACLFFVL
jgi:hypothetical protein